MANEENLKPNSERTPKERENLARKAGRASGKARKRRQSLEEAAQAAAKVMLNDIGSAKLKRKGLNIDDVDPEDMTGVMAVALGQMAAAINGNSQAAQNFADWLDLPAKHKKEKLEREKLEAEIEKLKAEVSRLRSGQDADADDQVLQFIEGMKAEAAENDPPDAEAD